MARRWHYLRPNVSTDLPAHVFYVDTETVPVKVKHDIEWHRFDIAVSCYARRRSTDLPFGYIWQRWTDSNELVSEIARLAVQRRTLYVIMSNPVFDLWVLDAYRRLASLGFTLSFFYDKGLCHILKCKNGRSVIYVLAIQNYYHSGVEMIGKLVGLPKLDVDIKTVQGEKRWEYCRRDVEILLRAFELWLAFVKDNDMGGFALTRTSQAMRAFRHRFMNEKILIHGEDDVTSWERSSYFGGRVECFRLGTFTDGPFLSIDVNSMYPFIMREIDLPTRLVNVIKEPMLSALEPVLEKRCLTVHTLLQTNEPAFGVRKNNTIVFPVGTFWAWLSTPAFQYAIGKGYVKAVAECALYEKRNIFREFITFFYALRQHYKAMGNAVYDQICKYMLNGLYGKWGQLAPDILYSGKTDAMGLTREYVIDAETGQHLILTKLMGKEWIESGRKETSNSFVAISSHITEAARILLWQFVSRLPRGRVLYCDTDSLIIRERDLPAFADVLDPNELGSLAIEKQASSIEIRGLKDYRFGEKQVIKGIRKDAELIAPNRYRQLMFPGIYSLLRDAAPGLFPIITRTKVLKREYKKGILDKSTCLLSPFQFNLLA